MYNMSRKTRLCEQKVVNTLPDKKWKDLFDDNINEIKIKFSIGNFIKIYHIKNIDTKKKILEILGFQFVLRSKKI